MPLPIGPYINLPDYPGAPPTSIEALISGIFARHGLLALTDVEQPVHLGGPLGIHLDAEAIEQLRADKEKWDDTPAPEKLLAVLFGMLTRPKKPPEPVNARLVGVVPETHRTIIMVSYAFFPVPLAEITDLRKVGRWALSVRDGRGQPANFTGTVFDHTDQAGALELITHICARWQEELKLKPLKGNPMIMMGDPSEELAGYRDVPANYDNIPSLHGQMERIPPGEGVGYRRKQPGPFSPETIASIRRQAIAEGAFDDFRKIFPDEPTMTKEELRRSRIAAGLLPADEPNEPPEHKH